jgi:hypothetical protein
VNTSALRATTFVGMAVLAFIIACVSHEAAGHGLFCLGSGGEITLLTSAYAHCHPSRPLVDLAGPLMSLAVAAGAAVALHHSPKPSARAVFFGLLLAFSGFWGAGYCIFSAVTDGGDLAFVLRDLSLQPRWLWRVGMGLVGLLLYGAIRRQAATVLPNGRLLLVAYCIVGAVSCVAVLFYQGPQLPALRESAQESLLAPIGLLFVFFGKRPSRQYLGPASPGIIALSVVATVVFWLTLGRGVYGS